MCRRLVCSHRRSYLALGPRSQQESRITHNQPNLMRWRKKEKARKIERERERPWLSSCLVLGLWSQKDSRDHTQQPSIITITISVLWNHLTLTLMGIRLGLAGAALLGGTGSKNWTASALGLRPKSSRRWLYGLDWIQYHIMINSDTFSTGPSEV